MGASCSIDSSDSSSARRRISASKFRTQDLRAPLFPRSAPEKVDCKANHKYCCEEIIQNLLRHSYENNEISFEQLKRSYLAAKILEQNAREEFMRTVLSGNSLVGLQDLKSCYVKVSLPELKAQARTGCQIALQDLRG